MILLDCVVRVGKTYPQTLLEECKYVIKLNKMKNLVNDDSSLNSSNDKSDDESGNESDDESSDKKTRRDLINRQNYFLGIKSFLDGCF